MLHLDKTVTMGLCSVPDTEQMGKGIKSNGKEVNTMKTNTKTGREIIVTVPDKVGVLSRISTVVSENNANIQAICGYAVDGMAHVRLLTDNNEKARDSLHRAGFNATEHDVILTELSPHSIHPEITNYIGDVDTGNNYWCAASHCGEHAVLVFSPKDSVRMSSVR